MLNDNKRFNEEYVKNIILQKTQPLWYIENILSSYQYDESFLRQMWNHHLWLSHAVQRNYHLSWDFLREHRENIAWSDIICFNKTYSEEEKEQIKKEFDLISDEDGNFWCIIPKRR